MIYKKSLIFICLILCLFSIASVVASDLNDTDVANESTNLISVQEQDINQISKETVLNESEYDNKIYDGNIASDERIRTSGNNVTVKNFVFANGYSTIDYVPGALTWSGNNGKLINCTFINNRGSPGALLVTGINLTVINCTFKDNSLTSLQFGGAICWKGANGTIINSIFTGTRSGNEGGAIYWSAPNAKIVNCTFKDNYAWRGGAIQFGNYYGDCHNSQVINSTFISNSDSQGGGAIYIYGAKNVTIDGCNFIENAGSFGILNGGLVTNCIFYNNNAFSSESRASSMISGSFNHCLFLDNVAKKVCYSIVSGGSINNCIFLNNIAKNGCTNIVSSSNLNYNWFGNTYEDYNVVPNDNDKLKNWLFLNTTYEQLMIVGKETRIPFEFKVWNGTTVLDYDSSRLYPILLNLSATNGEIDKTVIHFGESISYNASKVGNGTLTAKFFDSELAINLICKNPTEIIANDSITIYVDQFMNFDNGGLYAALIPSEAGNLTFSTDDETILNVTDTGFIGFNEGIANLIVEFKETEDYAPSKVLVPINVIRYDTEITSNDTMSIDYGESANIDAFLTPDVGSFVYASDDVNVATVDENGLISAINAGTTNIRVKFEGNRKYKPSNKTILLTVNKIDSSISIENNFVFNYGDSNTILTNVEGAKGLDAFILKHAGDIVNVNNNMISVSNLNVGKYTLRVTTIPDGNHNAVTTTANITVNKVDSSMVIPEIEFDYGSSASINPIVDGISGITDVRIINHPEADIIVKNNMIEISNLDIGTYTLTATTVPDSNHNPITNTTKITVVKPDSSIIFSNNLVFDYGGSDSTTVILNGASGITNVNVIGHPEAIINIKNNVITVLGLDAGMYTLVATTIPNNSYNAVTGTAEIQVNKVDSSIKFTKELVFDYVGSDFEFVVLNGAIGMDVSVVNHPNVDISCDESSIALFGLDVGTYKFTITTIPDKNHNAVTLEVPFKVIKSNPIITVKKRNGYTASSTLKAIVEDGFGNFINEGRLKFSVGGKSYQVKVHDGIGQINVKLPKAKTYSYKATFISDNFNSKSVSSKITVKQSKAKVSTKKITSIAGDYFTLKAIVKNSAGKKLDEGSIKFSINGKSYKSKVNNGVATKKLKLSNVKTYTYRATFLSKYYKAKTTTSKVVVKKQPVFTIKIGEYSVKISYKDYKKIKRLEGFQYLVKTYDTGKTVDCKIYKDVKQVHTKKKLYSYGTYLTYYINNPDAMVAPYGYKFAGKEFVTEDGIEKVYWVYKKITYKKVLVKTTKTKVYIMVAADCDGASARIYHKISEYTDRYGSFDTKEYTGPYYRIF